MQVSSSATLRSDFDRNGTIGIGYLGVAVSSMVYGITCLQTFQYYMSLNATVDPRYLRTTVFVLWMLDSAQEALAIHIFYFYLVENYANPAALADIVWSVPGEILANTVIFAAVKSFFVLRIWRLSRNKLLTCLCSVLVVAVIVDELIYGIKFTSFTTLLEAEQKLRGYACSSLALIIASDSLIVGSLVYYLYRGRSGLPKSDSMISRIISLLISTSLLSLLVVVANLIAYLVAPSKLYVLFCNMLLGKMDVNAVLTSLNSRAFLRGNADSITLNVGSTLPLGTFRVDGSCPSFPTTSQAVESSTRTADVDAKAQYITV